MTDADVEEPLSNLSDSSFAIIGPGSFTSDLESLNSAIEPHSSTVNKINSTPNEPDKSVSNGLTQSQFSSASSTIGRNLEERLNQLLWENHQLKETLFQNNLALKSQLNTFFMWQQEVLKTHENHKQKFMETKELILKLRAENSDLKEHVNNVLQKSVIGGETFQSVTSNSCTFGGKEGSKETDSTKNEALKLEVKCKELEKQNKNLIDENERLKENLKSTENEILQLKEGIENLQKENLNIKKNNFKLTENSSPRSFPNSEARIQISNILKQLEEERAKFTKLKEEVELQKSNFTLMPEPKLSTTDELTQYIDKLDSMNNYLKNQNERFSGISSWILMTEGDLNVSKKPNIDSMLISEIAQLKSHLHEERNTFKKEQEVLQELQGHFQRLLKDYEVLQVKLSELEKDSLCTKKLKNEIQSVTKLSATKDQELAALKQECDKLREDVAKLNLECEEIAVLKVQVKVYQNDFNEEREAREKLVGEKEELAEKVRMLENQLKGRDQTSKMPLKFDDNENSKYMCPKCLFSFSDFRTCQEHVQECLNIHFYPC